MADIVDQRDAKARCSRQLSVLNHVCVSDRSIFVLMSPPRDQVDAFRQGADAYCSDHDVLVNSTGVVYHSDAVRSWTRDEGCIVDSTSHRIRFNLPDRPDLAADSQCLMPSAEMLVPRTGSMARPNSAGNSVAGLRIVPSRRAVRVRDARCLARWRIGSRARRRFTALAELRDTLLPKLMSGEIRVRDAEKVVEDVT